MHQYNLKNRTTYQRCNVCILFINAPNKNSTYVLRQYFMHIQVEYKLPTYNRMIIFFKWSEHDTFHIASDYISDLISTGRGYIFLNQYTAKRGREPKDTDANTIPYYKSMTYHEKFLWYTSPWSTTKRRSICTIVIIKQELKKKTISDLSSNLIQFGIYVLLLWYFTLP